MWLDPFTYRCAVTRSAVAGIEQSRGLEEQYATLGLGDWAVFDTARYDDHLAFADPNSAITELHGERAGDHEKQLVGIGMAVPVKRTLKLRQFHILPIQRRNDLGRPVIAEQVALGVEVDAVHTATIGRRTRGGNWA